MANTLYDTDFPAWAFQQAALLKDRKFDELDLDAIIDEIESMGKAEHRELLNRLTVLIAHLLKWQFQPERQGNSWRNTIRTQRDEIPEHIEDMPSLNRNLQDPDCLLKAWKRAVKIAARETYKPISEFPAKPIWTIDEILDENFYPSTH